MNIILLIWNVTISLPLAVDVLVHRDEQILPDTEDGVAYENQDEEPVAMVEELPASAGITLNLLGNNFFFFFNFPPLSISFIST